MFQVNDFFIPLVKIMSESMEKKINAALKTYGVTSGQVHMLIVLNTMDNKESTLKELEKIFSFSQAAIAATAARMEARGLLKGRIAENDKRIKYVQLTTRGKEIAELANRKLIELNEELLEGFTGEERQILMCGLNTIFKKLHEI